MSIAIFKNTIKYPERPVINTAFNTSTLPSLLSTGGGVRTIFYNRISLETVSNSSILFVSVQSTNTYVAPQSAVFYMAIYDLIGTKYMMTCASQTYSPAASTVINIYAPFTTLTNQVTASTIALGGSPPNSEFQNNFADFYTTAQSGSTNLGQSTIANLLPMTENAILMFSMSQFTASPFQHFDMNVQIKGFVS